MAPNHLPEPKRGRPQPASGPHLPTRRQPGAPPPVHDPRTLGLVDRPGREYWWERIGVGVRNRIESRVGPIVEWWAYCPPANTQRPYAVVLGERGLAVTSPTVSDSGGPAQRLTVLPFVPGSMRHAVVVQEPGRHRSDEDERQHVEPAQ